MKNEKKGEVYKCKWCPSNVKILVAGEGIPCHCGDDMVLKKK